MAGNFFGEWRNRRCLTGEWLIGNLYDLSGAAVSVLMNIVGGTLHGCAGMFRESSAVWGTGGAGGLGGEGNEGIYEEAGGFGE